MPVQERLQERPEISSFIRTWNNKPKEQVVEELASYCLETKRIPDPYHFLVVTSGELLSPATHSKIREVVQRTTPLGEIEYQALLSIERWAQSNGEGVIAWISPPYAGVYPTSKIIISQIEQKDLEKRLSNTAIVLDFNENECLKLAQGLIQYSRNHPLITHPDMLRANPLILNTKGIHWTYILGEFIDLPQVWDAIRRGDDKIAKKDAIIQCQIVYQALFGATREPQDAKIMLIGMLGDKPGSCPVLMRGTAFQIFSQNSFTVESSSIIKDKDFVERCPVCDEQIMCVVKKGQSCPQCGAKKECG